MPRGTHYTNCLECGAGFFCGDCIEMHCYTCQGKEHILCKMGWRQLHGFFPRWIHGEKLLHLTAAYNLLRQQYPALPESPDIGDAYRLKLPEVEEGSE